MRAASDRNEAAFGSPLGVYRGSARRALYLIGGGALFILGLVIALTGVVDRAASSPLAALVSQFLPNGSSVATLILVGLVIAFGGGFYLWRFIATAGQRVAVYEEGFSARLRGETTVARWGDVAAVRREVGHLRLFGIPLTTSRAYTLSLKDGVWLTLDSAIGGLKALGALIEERVAMVQAPAALATVRAGGAVTFGRWTVSAAGISKGDALLPWSEVEGVAVDDTLINLLQRGKLVPWSWGFLAATPNVATLIALVEHLRQGTDPLSPSSA